MVKDRKYGAIVFAVLALLLIIALYKSWQNRSSGVPEDTAWPKAPAVILGKNPFGLMLGAKNINLTKKIALVKELGVVYYRPTAALFVDRWNKDKGCLECEAPLGAGLKLVLTIRNGGGQGSPSRPPNDLMAYQKTVSEILKIYQPALLVVENEENSRLFYTGTPREYLEELRAACQVAHAQGINCTNGGLVSSLVSLLTAEHYPEQGRYQQYLGNRAKPLTQEQKEKGQQLIVGYKEAGADYLNFHWYNADPEALAETVAYLQDTSGLPALTNEVGQQENEDPAQVTAIMAKIVELRLPIAVWFSLDMESLGGARALTDQNGNLRPNGQAFKSFIEGRDKQGYSCPKKTWVDCMPGPGPSQPECSPAYLTWAKKNCPNFQGPVY